MEISRDVIEQLVFQVLKEKLGKQENIGKTCGNRLHYQEADGVLRVSVPQINTCAVDRLDTGCNRDKVYTHDLFSLTESPRLGCGIMEMEETTFNWTLDYDEIDYVIEGSLSIIKNGKKVTAGPGEIILIPKGSSIQFSVSGKARFLYVTYPADWNSAN